MRFFAEGAGRRPRFVVTAGLAAAVLTGLTGISGCGGGEESGSPKSEREAEGSASGAPRPSNEPAWNTKPSSLTALGDSITVGFHACGPLSDCLDASWVTGMDSEVDSLARRLLDRPERDATNHAASGATVSDLPAQAVKAVADKPELVTILMGANDACARTPEAMTTTDQFEKDLRQSINTLREGLPKAQLFVVSIPDLQRLWQVGKDEKNARDVWNLGICQSMLSDPRSTNATDKDRRTQVSQQVTAYNTVLRETCASDKLCRYDEGVVHDHPFAQAELSQWDWFHPSKGGQQVLARLAHKAVTARD